MVFTWPCVWRGISVGSDLMAMKIIKAYPPNFSLLSKHFPIKGKPGILYAWGDVLYNPSGVKVTPWVMAHEEVHGMRQLPMGLDNWWKWYIGDSPFRLAEELLAHRAEWQSFKTEHVFDPGVFRILNYLNTISTRLSSPLYGSLLSFEEAKRRIADG